VTATDISRKDHWDRVYNSNESNKLGWFEQIPEKSLELIKKSMVQKDDLILDIGTGASTLIDFLLEQGYINITATDISKAAIEKSKNRLGREKASLVKWIVDDITQAAHIVTLSDVTLWHDRAVLHFLLEDKERQKYLAVLNKVLKKGGHVIIAAFSLKGAKKCSGLDIINYDEYLLADFLGKNFQLKAHFDYTYHMPSGASRPYIYTLFQKIR